MAFQRVVIHGDENQSRVFQQIYFYNIIFLQDIKPNIFVINTAAVTYDHVRNNGALYTKNCKKNRFHLFFLQKAL